MGRGGEGWGRGLGSKRKREEEIKNEGQLYSFTVLHINEASLEGSVV